MKLLRYFYRYGFIATVVVGLFLCPGCKPADYRRQADTAAAGIIQQKQKEVLGQSEPFTVEPAADALRQRIILASGLPYSGPASLGTAHLERIEHWPEKGVPYQVKDSQPPAAPWNAEQPSHLTLVDALQIAARNNRDYQTVNFSPF